MKSILIFFEDAEFKIIKKRKGKKSWHDFVMDIDKGE